MIGKPDSPQVAGDGNLISVLRDEIASAASDTVILSSEYLVLAKLDEARQLRKVLVEELRVSDVKVCIYLRRHDLWFESLFNQSIKTQDAPPWGMDITDFVVSALGGAGQEVRYLTTLERWARAFGSENIVVRPFEKTQFANGSLIDDFLSIVGKSPESNQSSSPSDANVSIPAVALYVTGLLRQLPPSAARDRAIGAVKKLDAENAAFVPGSFGELRPRHRRSIVNFFSHEYATIAKKYLNRSDGRLFYDPIAAN
jgi:hypothetical protein